MVDLFDQPTGKGSGELILVIGPESGELLLVNRPGGSDKVDGGGVDRGGGLGEAGSEWNMEGRCGRWNIEGRWDMEYVGTAEWAGAVVAAILDTGCCTRWPGKEKAEWFSNNLQRDYFAK